MLPIDRQIASLLLAASLAGCQGAGGLATPPRHAASHAPVADASTPPVSIANHLPVAVPVTGSTLITDLGSGIISNNAGSLTGVVRAPASIVANNGGSIVANNGSGIVANNGSGFRLFAATDQVPLAGRVVSLVDAGGKPVTGPDGAALTATTDASGRYTFTSALPLRNLLVRVDLQKAGTLAAIAPRGGKQADVDLVTTLTTGYILTQYVKSQSDPLATLEKLPADVEATTRQKAADALAKDAAAAPAAFTDALVITSVERLRKQDTAFNDQLEVVKKLLVAAGLSDLGSGLLGTAVTISDVVAMAPGPDGSVYLDAQNDSRIWRLNSDGHIVTAVGNGTPIGTSLDGVAGADAGIASPLGMAVDDKGRLIILENSSTNNFNAGNLGLFSRITRLEANGKLTQLWIGDDTHLANTAVPGPDGRVYFSVTAGGFGPPMGAPAGTPNTAELWSVGDDKQARLEHQFVGKAALAFEGVSNYSPYGVDAQGRLILNTVDIDSSLTGTSPLYPTVYAVDLKTFALTALAHSSETSTPPFTIDALGHVFGNENPFVSIKPDGTRTPVVGAPGAPTFVESALQLPDGSVYFALAQGVQRLKDGKLTLQVGGGKGGVSDATSVALDNLAGVAAAADGTLIVAAKNQLFRLVDKKLVAIAGTPAVTPDSVTGPVGPALSAVLSSPSTVHVGANGLIYFTNGHNTSLFALNAAGILSSVPGPAPESQVYDYVVAADGALYWEADNPAAAVDPAATGTPDTTYVPAYRVMYQSPGSAAEAIATCDNQEALALDSTGALSIVGDTRVRRWTRASGLTTLLEDPRLDLTSSFVTAGVAYDSKGRLYVPSPDKNLIYQIDLTSRAFKIVAGAGGSHFSGSGVDGSILNPHAVTFTPNGDLYFADFGHKQVKRIPAAEL